MTNKKYVLLKSFVGLESQLEICHEALTCHSTNNNHNVTTIIDPDITPMDQHSWKLSLGIDCGGDISIRLPRAADQLRQAFAATAAQSFTGVDASALQTFSDPCTR